MVAQQLATVRASFCVLITYRIAQNLKITIKKKQVRKTTELKKKTYTLKCGYSFSHRWFFRY